MPLLKVLSRLLLIAMVLITISFAGCPDYSHLQPVPDYKSMTDGGAENE